MSTFLVGAAATFFAPWTMVITVPLLVTWAAAVAASLTGANDEQLEDWDNGLVTYGSLS